MVPHSEHLSCAAQCGASASRLCALRFSPTTGSKGTLSQPQRPGIRRLTNAGFKDSSGAVREAGDPLHGTWQYFKRLRPLSALWSKDASHLDPGHWDRSPEWYGSQHGGWGRGDGALVFKKSSKCGNGQVEVTAHTASPAGRKEVEEWRVLRFNGFTRQSVTRVHREPAPPSVGSNSGGSGVAVDQVAPAAVLERQGRWVADPECLAFPYTKAIASAVASVVGVAGVQHWMQRGGSHSGARPNCLCLGMGGGSVPLFLAHHFPLLQVQGVDVDPVVVDAARHHMGFPPHRAGLEVVVADAVQHVAQLAGSAPGTVDLAVLDLYDGRDAVPADMLSPGFLGALSKALHPAHGTAIVNLHGGGLGGFSFSRLLTRGQGPGYVKDSEKGSAVVKTAAAFKAGLLQVGGGRTRGLAYTLSVASQGNIILVVTRAVKPGAASGLQHYETMTRLQAAADAVSTAAGFVFTTDVRATRGFTPC